VILCVRFCPRSYDDLDFDKEIIIFYTIIILKKIRMVKICCGEVGRKILLLVKICTINLLIKIYMYAVQLENIVVGNIIARKNLHN
jgi:hypothetical protein